MPIRVIQGEVIRVALSPSGSSPARIAMTNRLALVGVLLLLTLQACQRSTQEVSLATLVHRQDDFHGMTVTAMGMVTRIEEPTSDIHYVLEDEMSNRVELLPKSRVARWAGEKVAVTGTFRFQESRGRTLTIDSIRAFPQN